MKMIMKGVLLWSGLAIVSIFLVFGEGDRTLLAQGESRLSSIESQQAFVNQYCLACHNDSVQGGGFSWTQVDLAVPEQHAEQLEKVIRKVRVGLMPPTGMPRPDTATLKAFTTALETRIDHAAAARPHANAPELHRMNRTEYRNAVRDLLGVDVDVSEILPPDASTAGFDNMSNALTVTPALMSAYIRAAERVSREAIGDPQGTPGTRQYTVSMLVNQTRHIEGTPFGTRGGISVLHTFPADGEYTFNVDFHTHFDEQPFGSALPVQLQGQEIEISVDGERVAALTFDPLLRMSEVQYVTPPVKAAAGQRRLAAAFVSKFDGPVQDHYRLVEQTTVSTDVVNSPEMTALPHLRTLTVTGPFNPTGVSENATRRKIFTCRPTSAGQEDACATEIISRLTGRAFRRPATAEDLEAVMGYYEHGWRAGGFEVGIRAAIQAILARPEFLFRFEYEPADVVAGENYRVSDLELASRLSYFLWSTIPDEELIGIAGQGQLKDPAILEQQVQRMLADPRSEALARNFAGQWLRLSGISRGFPDGFLFPNFTRNLADSMLREVELLFDSIMREDRNVLDLLTADYTFVNEILAKHYGIPNVLGSRFRRVGLTDPNRFGLLGKAGVMMMTSMANRTSPVMRGSYVLEVLIGTPPPRPPAVVPELEEAVANQRLVSVRERIEQHRKSPACSSCHRIMDPIGLALENFDAIGAWRVNDGGFAIDPSGEMYDGTTLDGPVSLREALLSRSEPFLGNFTEKLLAYGLGRVLDYRDMPTVRSIAREAAENDNRFSPFILGIVKSTPFYMRAVSDRTQFN